MPRTFSFCQVAQHFPVPYPHHKEGWVFPTGPWVTPIRRAGISTWQTLAVIGKTGCQPHGQSLEMIDRPGQAAYPWFYGTLSGSAPWWGLNLLRKEGEGVELEGLPGPQEKGSVTVQTCLSFLTV